MESDVSFWVWIATGLGLLIAGYLVYKLVTVGEKSSFDILVERTYYRQQGRYLDLVGTYIEGFLIRLKELWRLCKNELIVLGITVPIIVYCLNEKYTYEYYKHMYTTRIQPLLEALGQPALPYTPGLHGPGFPEELNILLWISVISALLALVSIAIKTHFQKWRDLH